MDSSIDKDKLDKMWTKILEYERTAGLTEKDKNSVKNIGKILDEVYKECL